MIYLVYGEQFPLVNKRVHKLIKSILNEEIDEFNFVRINAKETTVQDIAYEASLLPFSNRKVIRVDNAYFLSLDEPISVWVEKILSCKNFNRTSKTGELAAAGYDYDHPSQAQIELRNYFEAGNEVGSKK